MQLMKLEFHVKILTNYYILALTYLIHLIQIIEFMSFLVCDILQ